MDFTPADDHPESSPWGSSPQPHRQTFEPTTETVPSDAFHEPGGFVEDHPADNSHPPQPTDAVAAAADAPTAQPAAQQPPETPVQKTATRRTKHDRTQFKLQAKITGLERNGRKDPILKFDVYTNLPRFRTTQYRDVRRTHSEFIKLAEHLMSANPEAMVPAVPPATTSAGAGTEEDEIKVKNNMQRWLSVVCANDVLIRDEEMQLFVESDFGYSPVVRRKQPATGMRRKVIKQFAPPPDDIVELAEGRPVVKRFYLATMDAGQKIDRVVKSRRALGLAESQMGVNLSQLSPQETHGGLATAYRKLGAVIRGVGDFHLQQGTFEASSLTDPLQYHSSDAFVVKETLTNRQILMRDHLAAKNLTVSRMNAADRLRSSKTPNRDKVDEAIANLEEAKRVEESLDKKCQSVTKHLVVEQRKWQERTSGMLKASVREYAIRQIEAERRTLATLESVRPEIRAIDNTGGLSRLGREQHPKPAARRSSALASSQGPRGDAWSGVQRPSDGVRRAEVVAGAAGQMPPPPPEDGAEIDGPLGRQRAASGSGLKGLLEDDDEDRVDARNAASRLAQTTF